MLTQSPFRRPSEALVCLALWHAGEATCEIQCEPEKEKTLIAAASSSFTQGMWCLRTTLLPACSAAHTGLRQLQPTHTYEPAQEP